MKRLLTTTTALSVALASMQPFPLFAQTLMEDGSVLAADGSVVCTPTADAPCVLADYLPAADADADAAAAAIAAQAEAEAASQADVTAQAEAAAAAEAQAAADAAIAAQAEADAAAVVQAQADADAQAQVEADAQAQVQAEAEAAAAAQAEAVAEEQLRLQAAQAEAAEAAIAAQAEADAAAASQAEADAAAAAQADADAAIAAQADADAAAAAQAATDAAAQLDADAAEALRLQTEQNEAAAAAATQAQADAETAAQTDADAAAQAEADAAADLKAQADADAAVQADTDADAAAQAGSDAEAADDDAVKRNADGTEQSDADAAAAAIAAQGEAGTDTAPADDATDPEVVIAPVDPATETVPLVEVDPAAEDTLATEPQEPTEAAVQTLEQLLDAPVESGDVLEAAPAVAAAAAAVAAPDAGEPLTAQTTSDPSATVTTTTVTETTTRTSTEEFEEAPERDEAPGDGKNRLSDLEKVGLVALGALVVGAILKNGDRVEQNTGDRVVVQRDDGRYVVYKDDDTLLRRPGSTLRTENFRDGSTRTIVERENGTQVVTIRDASGRVLRRATYDEDGREIVLIDDLQPETRVVVRDLPPLPREEVTLSASDGSDALRDAIRASESRDIGRSFSLRQVREIREVRGLAASIDVDSITFDTGSSAIRASEAEKLAKLGGLITDLVEENPNEVFLIEGHTDAVGSAASNLALSDRRAESVALALTEYFDVPPENLVVQGYGEAELRIETGAEERRNRRVAVRVVTGLLQQASLQ